MLQTNEKQEMLCGYRYWLIAEPIERFLRMMCDAGAELVFFKDGPPKMDKLKTWSKRQSGRYADILKLYDKLCSGQSLEDVLKDPQIAAMRVWPDTAFFEQMCQIYGPLHVSTRECDLEMAKYAIEHNALAIISQVTYVIECN